MDLIIIILPVVTKDLPISPRFTPYNFLSRCKFSTLTTRQPMVEFYLLTFPCFPLRKKEHKSYFGKNRTHDFRTSRCAGYLLDHSGDELTQENTMEGPLWRETLGRSLGSYDAAELVGGMWQARNHPPPRHILRKDGMELLLTIGCSIRHWLDPFARVKSSLLLKIHSPSDRELTDKTADWTRYVWTSQQRRGQSSTTTLDSRIRPFYSTLPSSALVPALIWGMQDAM